MKVKCISNMYNFLTKDKYYEVLLSEYLRPYVIDDSGERLEILNDNDIFKFVCYESPTTQKTLRDEFAMAVINAMGHQHDYRKTVEYTALAEAAYEIADAMLEVRNENEQTKE